MGDTVWRVAKRQDTAAQLMSSSISCSTYTAYE